MRIAASKTILHPLRVPVREPVVETATSPRISEPLKVIEAREQLTIIGKHLDNPLLPDRIRKELKELQEFFTGILRVQEPSVKITGTACASKCINDIHTAALEEIDKLKETVREGPRDYIVPVDVDRGIWERWNQQEQRWKRFRTEQGVRWNPEKQRWKRKAVAQGRVA